MSTLSKKAQAQALLQNNSLMQALHLYEELCQGDPRDAESWHMRSAIHGMLGQFAESENCARRVIAMHPDAHSAHNNLGLAQMKQGKQKEARRSFEKALQLQPDDPETFNNLAALALENGDYAECERLCRQAIRHRPLYAPAWNNLGNALLKMQRREEALECFQRAASLNPRFTDAVCNAGALMLALNRHAEAARYYQHLLALQPGHPDAMIGMAAIAREQGRLDEAENFLTRALAVRQGDAMVHMALAEVLRRKQQMDFAIEQAREAVRLNPAFSEAHLFAANLYVKVGRLAEAVGSFKEVLRLDPDNTHARHFLAAAGGAPIPKQADARYVSRVFDDYAETFDRHLVEKLEYRTPRYLHDSLARIVGDDKRGLTVLDLGCGTGLCAPFLRPWANRLIGVDLSAKMIGKARQRNLYDELIVGDMLDPMNNCAKGIDLICAADVLVYVGDLDPVFRAASASLSPSGHFAFSTEHHEGDENYLLRTSGRYAHSPRYIRDLAARYGLAVLSQETQIIRKEADQSIYGDVFILAAAGSS